MRIVINIMKWKYRRIRRKIINKKKNLIEDSLKIELLENKLKRLSCDIQISLIGKL